MMYLCIFFVKNYMKVFSSVVLCDCKIFESNRGKCSSIEYYLNFK